MVFHPVYLNPPPCLPDGVCSMVAADRVSASLTRGFCGVVAIIIECSHLFVVLVFALVWALWHSRWRGLLDVSTPWGTTLITSFYSTAHSVWTVGQIFVYFSLRSMHFTQIPWSSVVFDVYTVLFLIFVLYLMYLCLLIVKCFEKTKAEPEGRQSPTELKVQRDEAQSKARSPWCRQSDDWPRESRRHMGAWL